MSRIPPWYRARRYRHFDSPLAVDRAIALATDPESVARRAYYPLIRLSLPKFRRDRQTGKVTKDSREVLLASHGDSHIYSHYGYLLRERLDRVLNLEGLSDAVLAYRRHPNRLSSLDFATRAFADVRQSGECTCIALDIEHFFDALDHTLLKTAWAAILGTDALPDDHYSVFRSVTRYAWVDRGPLYDALGILPHSRVPRWRPLCDPRTFRRIVRDGGLIQTNTRGVGIPQGASLSATLSNLYLLEFDRRVAAECAQYNCRYYRYSDDILLICPTRAAESVELFVRAEIAASRLSLNDAKRSVSNFVLDGDRLVADRPLQYLGLVFDGTRVLVRAQTLSRYSRRVLRTVRRFRTHAVSAASDGGRRALFRRTLYRRFSHLSRSRGFYPYIRLAARITSDPSIKRQMRRHWRRLQALVDAADSE